MAVLAAPSVARRFTVFVALPGDTEIGPLFLKILYRRPAETETSPYYWKREYEVYRSGMLDNLPANAFATPEIFQLEDFGDCCWIWMEDLRDSKAQWSLADYGSVALRLGRFNGAYLSEYELPDYLLADQRLAQAQSFRHYVKASMI